jgi:hypothetical protein
LVSVVAGLLLEGSMMDRRGVVSGRWEGRNSVVYVSM